MEKSERNIEKQNSFDYGEQNEHIGNKSLHSLCLQSGTASYAVRDLFIRPQTALCAGRKPDFPLQGYV